MTTMNFYTKAKTGNQEKVVRYADASLAIDTAYKTLVEAYWNATTIDIEVHAGYNQKDTLLLHKVGIPQDLYHLADALALGVNFLVMHSLLTKADSNIIFCGGKMTPFARMMNDDRVEFVAYTEGDEGYIVRQSPLAIAPQAVKKALKSALKK